jgi:membrane-associated phospholipid phosphatase
LIVGIYLQKENRIFDFQEFSFAVNLGYLISYILFPLVPLHGPRWSLVDAGLLAPSEQLQKGFCVTRLTNQIMFKGLALKGGAMPSAHSSTAMIFLLWCWEIWGLAGGMIGIILAVGMGIGAIYGRYHFLTDVLVGALLGTGGFFLARCLG